MADDFGLKIGLEGEKEFKKALADINQSFKVLGSEMKLVTSQFDKNDTSVEALTARNEVLNKEIEAQRQKIETLRQALANAAESFGENDRRTQAWQIQLNNAEAALNGMERELKDNNDALEQAEKGNRKEFKRIINSTQSDVNAELAGLGDPDLAHLIALGGWVRALEASAAAIEQRFDAQQAAVIFYPDAPAYFREILAGLHPRTARRLKVEQMSTLLEQLVATMSLTPGEYPSPGKVSSIRELAGRISTIAVGAGYEH